MRQRLLKHRCRTGGHCGGGGGGEGMNASRRALPLSSTFLDDNLPPIYPSLFFTMQRQGEPWFEDGNLVLLAEDRTGFRIHRGVLARQSEVFESMLSMPSPSPTSESSRNRDSRIGVPDGCQTVEMHDKSNELSTLLEAIYDGEYVQSYISSKC